VGQGSESTPTHWVRLQGPSPARARHRWRGARHSVQDDGAGIPGWPSARAGHGLRNMQARSRRLGAALEIDSGSKGTTITIAVQGML
jgi:signal transduction histidine kinase